MIPKLYEHQEKIIREGRLKCGLFLGTGASKTRTALELAEGETLVICPKQQREDKTWERENEKWGTDIHLKVISKEDIRKMWDELSRYETVIIDECFVKGTKVLTINGYKNIEEIKLGDTVVNATGVGNVYSIIKKTADKLVTIELANYKKITCTVNHPFLTTEGWMKAGELTNTTLLVQPNILYWEYENKNITRLLQTMRGGNTKRVAPWWVLWSVESLLFNKMQDGYNKWETSRRTKKACQTYLNFVFQADDRKQSHEEKENKNKSFKDVKSHRSQTKNSRWQWYKNAYTSKSVISGSWKRLVSRICSENKRAKRKTQISNLLQNRYSQSKKNDSYRSRWWQSLYYLCKRKRQEENELFRTIGVARVEVQKSRSNGQSSESTKVYNLSVSNHPSYIVEGVIVHNCHNNLGVMPAYVQRNKVQIPKTSQIFEATRNYIYKNDPNRLYLLSATPVPKPMSMWAIGELFGQLWDFAEFRRAYYIEIRMGGVRRIWMPKKDEATKQRLANLVQKFGYTGSLNDFFDVPDQTHKVVEIDLSAEQKRAVTEMTFSEADPLVRRARLRTIENGVLYGKQIEEIDEKTDRISNKTIIFKSHKIDYILERAQEFPKLLIFANYTAQIEEIEKHLRKADYNVSTLTGKTKDRTFIKKVNDCSDPHIIIAQCSISSGYELPSFPCVIYASKSWRFVDYEQSTGRVLRANHLKKNLYIHLVVEGCDKDCHDSIMSGQDFQEKLTLNI